MINSQKVYNKSQTVGFDPFSGVLDKEIENIQKEMHISYNEALTEFGRRYEMYIPDAEEIDSYIEENNGMI